MGNQNCHTSMMKSCQVCTKEDEKLRNVHVKKLICFEVIYIEPMHFYVILVLVINHRVIVSIVLLY